MTILLPRAGRNDLLIDRWEYAVATKLRCPQSEVKPSYRRLVESVTDHWEGLGAQAMSARQIGILAEAPVSSIYHHFGSLEQLFVVSSEECLVAAEAWCEEQVRQLAGFRASTQGFGSYFAQLVDEWSHSQRTLAFAWRECQLLAQRKPEFVALARRWQRMWSEFWLRVSEIFALGANTIVVERIFDTESLLHMMRWRRSIDRAALDETGRALAAWLGGETIPDAPWRDFAHAQALQSVPDAPVGDEVVMRVRQSAAHLIGVAGVAGVTHRAVAEHAGLTLGAVSHKFKTKSALLEAAFEGIYASLTAQPASAERPATKAVRPNGADIVIQAVERAGHGNLNDELFVAVARDPNLSGFGAQLRYLRGRTSRAALQTLLGDRREASILEGALFSSYLSSQLRACVGQSVEDARLLITRELHHLQSLLRAEPGGSAIPSTHSQ